MVTKNTLSWDELAQQFEMSLSESNIKFTDGSILSKMSRLLSEKSTNTIKGVDDDRITGIPYSVKAMNLLVIVYLNMCGLEDQLIVNTQMGQLVPLIHHEYCSGESNGGLNYNTDRTNFAAAVLEFTLLHYKKEICAGSNIKQCKRLNWAVPANKLRALEDKASVCLRNCSRLVEEELLWRERLNESVWVACRESFMPVLGLATSKPWTPLALWSSFVLYFLRQ